MGATAPLKKPYKPYSSKLTQVDIRQITFVSDHHKLLSSYSQLFKNELYLNEGDALKKPDWTKDGKNQPVTHSRGRKVKLKLDLVAKPAGHLFEIRGAGKSLHFRKKGVKSTGRLQPVELESTDRLAHRIDTLGEAIQWFVDGKPIVKSGPHTIYVLWADPKPQNSWKMKNVLTEKRVALITKIASTLRKVDDIAAAVQKYLNDNTHLWAKDPNVKRHAIDFQYNNGAQFWGLLDGVYTGQCGETAFLMEMMVRMLGVDAVQKQIHAVTRLPVEKRVSCQEPQPFAPSPEERTCKVHGKEWLWLDLIGPNESEGCCEVNKKMYALYVIVDIIGSQRSKRTAAHHVLLELAKYYGRKVQIWVYQGKNKIEVCRLPKSQSGGDPNPPVPKF
jgi:hypothetical protein